MSIFRVEKSSNYTVISNYHLRDKNLSLKTIGLLSLILSLPETWDYSQAGLASICKDGEDSIRSGLKELEKYGYLERERERDENGRMRGIIYHVYEIPKDKRGDVRHTIFSSKESKNKASESKSTTQKFDLPRWENPILVEPTLDSPTLELPTTDSPRLKKDIEYKDIKNKDKINTDELNTELLNIHPPINRRDREVDGLKKSEDYRNNLQKKLLNNVGYEYFEFKHTSLETRLEQGSISAEEYDNEMLTYDLRSINKIVGYMLDILSSLNKDPIKIGDELIDREVVRAKLMRVGIQEMKQTVYELNTNPTIKNPKKYAISMLYNS